MPIDLNVRIPTEGETAPFLSMARKLGFRGIASLAAKEPCLNGNEDGLILVNRAEIHETSLSGIKKSAKRLRTSSTIVSLPLRNIDSANWAADDSRIDLLTLTEPINDHKLRSTTAKLAAASGTALEVPICLLLHTMGLARARLLKNIRENARIAVNAGMPIVLSSGSTDPMQMRSPLALSHAGLLLGLNINEAKRAAFDNPRIIVDSNLKRFQPEYLEPGMELIKRGSKK